MSAKFNFPSDILLNLSILHYEDPAVNLGNNDDGLEIIRQTYKNHPSIFAILQKQI